MSVLVLAELDGKNLSPATAKTLSAALAIGLATDILIVGKECEGATEQAAKLHKVRKVRVADSKLYEHALAENISTFIVPLMDEYEVLFVPDTANGKNIAPRVSALLDVQQISGITTVRSPDTFDRPIYAGNAIETVQTSQKKNVITVQPTAFLEAQADGNALIEPIQISDDKELSSFVREDLSSTDRPELTSARIVISGGRGMGSANAFTMLEPIAKKLNAAIGASRAAVDAGYVPNDLQVGQTGKIVAPELYIAVGISGAIQHLAGCKGAKVIVAINKDADAPIFSVADYGLVADLQIALPQLEKII